MIEKDSLLNKILLIFEKWSTNTPDEIIQLPNSGSSRIYYRIKAKNQSIIAAYNDNIEENKAFIDFTKQFLNVRINVPNILYIHQDQKVYFLNDLGNNTLLNWLSKNRTSNHFPEKATKIYKSVIRELIKMQIVAGKNFNYTHSYPFKQFDKQAILFDLNYFKTQFVDSLKITYNKNKLYKEFDLFAQYLLSEDTNYFMFRDFQARNIMLVNSEPFFIDYQGGRKGALQYDLASLLFQAKANIPIENQNELLSYYIHIARLFIPINEINFINYFYGYALVRVLQTLGAYGLRGIIERKPHFIESIPHAINNLKKLIGKTIILNQLPELKKLIETIILTEINTNNYVNSKH